MMFDLLMGSFILKRYEDIFLYISLYSLHSPTPILKCLLHNRVYFPGLFSEPQMIITRKWYPLPRC